MSAIISERFRIFNAKQFYESLTEPISDTTDVSSERTRMYFFVGRPQRWFAYLEIYNKNTTDFVAGRDKIFVGTSFASATFKADVIASYPNSLLLSGVGPTAAAVPGSGATVKGYNPLTSANTGAEAKSGVYRFATDDIPTRPYDNQTEKYDIYSDMIAAKRITGEFARPVVRRYQWSSVPTKYDMWRPDYSEEKLTANSAQTISTSKFYVLNSRYEVFKCLYNGQDLSNPSGVNATVEPTTSPANAAAGTYSNGIYSEPVNPATGLPNYIWKFMYSLPIDDVIRFLSTDFIPLPNSANSSYQTVQSSAINGSISAVVLKSAGANFPATPTTLYAPIIGDGSNGVVKITTAGGAMTSATLYLEGQDYTYGSVLFDGNLYSDFSLSTPVSSTGAFGTIEVVTSPQGGHGSDAIVELNAKRIMTNIRLTYAEGQGDFPVENDFRRIGILQDPKLANGSVATIDTLSNLYAVKLTSVTGIFQQDEEILQTLSGGNIAKGTVVSWTLDKDVNGNDIPGTGTLKYFQSPEIHQYNGKVRQFSGANAITGSVSNITGTPDTSFTNTSLGSNFTSGYALPEIQKNSGEIIYVENRRLITRAIDQVEDIKLVIEF